MAYTRGGLVDDGTSDMIVAGTAQAKQHTYSAQTLASSGSSITISQAGFYYVPCTGSSGAGFFTGSVPSPVTFPGATLIFAGTTDNGSFDWLLSGSAPTNGRALFVKMSGSMGGAPPSALGGGTVKMTAGGSIILVSDGLHWCITGGSGSMTLAGNNAL